MAYLVALVSLSFFLFNFYCDKTLGSASVLINLYWGVNVFLSELRLFDLPDTSPQVYFIILTGIVFFNIGCISARNLKIKKITKPKVYTVNTRLLKYAFILVFIYLLIFDLAVINLTLSGVDFWTIRYLYLNDIFTNSIFGFDLAYKLRLFLIDPILFAYVSAFFSSLVVTEHIDWRFFLRALLLTLMEYFAFGGRMLLLFWVSGALVSYSSLKKMSFMSNKKLMRWMKRLLVVFVISLPMVIIIRGGRGGHIFKSTYTYFVGSLPFLTQRLPYIGDKTYFVSSFQGVLRPIMGVLQIFNIEWELFEKANLFLLENHNTVVVMGYYGGKANTFNYFINCFGYFFKDGGYIGVAIFSIIWGVAAASLFKGMKRDGNHLYRTYFYIIVIYAVLISMMDFVMVESTFACSLFYYPFLVKRKREE